ncbi:MAG: S-layer homology domain-containing protein [Thermoanaerobaculia bacterium]
MIRSGKISLIFGSAVIALMCAGYAAAQRPNALPTTRDIPNAFGTDAYTVTTVPGVVFYPEHSGAMYNTSGSWGRFSPDHPLVNFFAALDLPAGAVIDYIGLNSLSDLAFSVGAEVARRDKFGSLGIIGNIDSTVHGWDTDFNASPLGYLWHGQSGEALILHVQVATDSNLRLFGWVEVWWKRSVSPAPGVTSFNDVPTSHPFFQFIEALKASGITGGCQAAPPLYCPEANLTRGQMAVFLSKALGLHWPAN